MFDRSKWIWCNETAKTDEYGEFYSEFTYDGGEAVVNISADSNYALHINGKLAAFAQYSDFPYDKVYDSVDISSFCNIGNNSFALLVWYYGIDTSSVYHPGNASVIFEIICDEKLVSYSNEHTLSRMSKAYKNHNMKRITVQLGLSFEYNSACEDNWMSGELEDFSESFIVNQNPSLRKRPCKKLIAENPVGAKEIKRISDNDIIFDLGTNSVGFLQIDIESDYEQKINISYGEHIADGQVRRKIGRRNFSVDVILKSGNTQYTNPFRRLGCRYLEIVSEKPVKVNSISIIPTTYPVSELPRPSLTDTESKIYDICINTLRLCMHEHYEDCPWREQALYCMDSRNQMLIGYYAFGEFEFPRSNLELIAADNREDNLLSICFPVKADYAIPSFSLHYFIECAEYLRYSGDKKFIRTIYPKLESILSAFIKNMNDDDLVMPFKGANMWNFYEWRPGLDGHRAISTDVPDLLLNALLSLGLQSLVEICDTLEIKNNYSELIEKLNLAINKTFYSDEIGAYVDRVGETRYSQLGNSLAILCGAADKKLAESLCEKMIADKNFTKISLSMKCFFYDALLKVNPAYKDYIFKDIEEIYIPMVNYGVGTVWETEDGEKDFDKAGSLCHGWSALPVYYYHLLKGDSE